jgi:hypothetical protein
MSYVVEITPELGSADTITQADMDSATRLSGNYTAVLATYVSKYLLSKHQNPDVYFTSYGDKPLTLNNYDYNTNGVVLKVTGTGVNIRKKRIYIEEAVQRWFSPVRVGYTGHQCLRYKFRGPSSEQAGVVSKLKPSNLTGNVNVYVVNNIILVFEG